MGLFVYLRNLIISLYNINLKKKTNILYPNDLVTCAKLLVISYKNVGNKLDMLAFNFEANKLLG